MLVTVDVDVGRPRCDRLLQRARVHERVRAGVVGDRRRGLEVERRARVVLDRAAADRRSIGVVAEIEIALARHIERARVLQHAPAVERNIAVVRRHAVEQRRPRSGLLIVVPSLNVAAPEIVNSLAPVIVPPVCVKDGCDRRIRRWSRACRPTLAPRPRRQTSRPTA